MLARWRPCSTTSGELYRRYCANKKENAGRVANYLRTMGTIWRALSRPEIMMMGQIAYLDAYGVLPVAWERQVARHTPYVGRGRGSAKRAQRVTEKIRSHIPHIARRAGPIADLIQRCGWKAFVTNATQERLSL